MSNYKKILIIGGGIFGCSISLELSKSGFDITLLEKDSDIMNNASKNNHNRVHYGYHYPRSIETATQSLDGLLSFLMSYKESIVSDFPNYYSISKNQSQISSTEYKNFCNKAGISYYSEYPSSNIVNPLLIEDSFRVEEPIFDWEILKNIIKDKLINSQVKLNLNTKFDQSYLKKYDFIINCTYSNINEVNKIMGLPLLKFKLQDVIIPIFEYKHSKIGLTVMDGPFCSIMPKGNIPNQFLLYHAKYSILKETEEISLSPLENIEYNLEMIKKDSSNYFPFLKDVKFIDYWRTTRAIPIVENDERLSKIITYSSNPNFITIFSGKISTCIKVAKQIKHGLLEGEFNNNISI
jgi:hypothetical protein